MFKLNIVHILHFSAILIPIAGDFDFKIHYCEFKCTWGVCTAEDAPEEEVRDKAKITGFYWRDYRGFIPDDAFPASNATQSPKSYIGLVNDIKSNGSFATTIFDGIDYVYAVLNGNVHKIDDDIQILCTQEPAKMKWVHLTDQQLKGVIFVEAGIYIPPGKPLVQKYLARVPSCSMNYVSSTKNRKDNIEYTLIDGSFKNATYFEFLYYQKESSDGSAEKQQDAKKNKNVGEGSSYFKSEYDYEINSNSIIPSFYKRIKAGPCSMVCTNRDKQNENGQNIQGKSDISLDYFWTPRIFFSKTLGLKTGVDQSGEDTYTGQAWSLTLGRDVGLLTGETAVTLLWENRVLLTWNDLKVLSTNHPEKFSWVPTNSTEFKNLNVSNLINGGTLIDGTKIYVGKVIEGNVETAGSIQDNSTSTNAKYLDIVPSYTNEFEVLMHV